MFDAAPLPGLDARRDCPDSLRSGQCVSTYTHTHRRAFTESCQIDFEHVYVDVFK